VRFVEGAAVEAVLPEVINTAVEPVDVLGVHQMSAADGAGKGILGAWRSHEMDLVGHEAESVDLQAVKRGALLEVRKVYRASSSTKKTSCRLFPRWVTWCAAPGTTILGCLALGYV
jgi:hypothetical protein